MKKTKLFFAIATVLAAQVPAYSFAAEADADKPLTAKERAAAKEKNKDEIETIVVQGYSGSEVAAINMKKFADTISANLSAEDIGVLPDRNIAESLTRLTGVSAIVDEGRTTQINVRGLGGGYSLTTLNGREIVSSWGGRSVNLSLYPAQAIRKAQVYKTSMADSLEGGIAGTVNLETIKPLALKNDIKSITVGINGNTNFDDVKAGDNYGTRIDGMYSTHITDDFAVAIGGAYQNEPQYRESYKAGETQAVKNLDGDLSTYAAGSDPTKGNDFAPTGHGFSSAKQDSTRASIFVAAQWQLTDNLLISLDVLSSDLEYHQEQSGLAFSVWNGFQAEPDLGPTIFNEKNIAVASSFSIDKLTSAPTSVYNKDTTRAFGLNFSYILNDSALLEVDFSRSTSDRVFSWRNSYDDFGAGMRHYVSYDHTDIKNPGFTYHGSDVNGDGNLTNVLNIASLYDFTEVNNPLGGAISENTAFKMDLTVDLDYDFFHQVKVGIRQSQNNKLEHKSSQRLGTEELVGLDPADYQTQLAGNRFSSYANVHGLENAFFYSQNAVLADYADMIPERELSAFDKSQSFDLTEDTSAFYLQASFAGDWFDGTIGARYYKTDLDSHGYQLLPKIVSVPPKPWENVDQLEISFHEDDADARLVRAEKTQSGILPTLNVNLRLIEDVVIRIGLGKAMMRPPVNHLNNGMKLHSRVNTGKVFKTSEEWGAEEAVLGKLGNPNLDYVESTQADISFEWYPNRKDFYALAFFHKKLDSLYSTEFFKLPIEGLEDPDGVPHLLPLAQEVNAEGGSVSGAEFSFRQNMGFVSDYLAGLSISGNYMKINHGAQQDFNYNGINHWDPDAPHISELLYTPLGWIDSTYNLGFTYDITRNLSARYNLSYNGEVTRGNTGNGQFGLRAPGKKHSFSLRYSLGDFTINGQIANMTDEYPTDSQLTLGSFDAPLKDMFREQQTLGTSYYINLSYRF